MPEWRDQIEPGRSSLGSRISRLIIQEMHEGPGSIHSHPGHADAGPHRPSLQHGLSLPPHMCSPVAAPHAQLSRTRRLVACVPSILPDQISQTRGRRSLVWCTRYAAVTTGLSIMTAIIELVLRAEERRSMLERQLKAAERARSRGRASDASAGTPGKSTRSQSQGDPKTASLRRERDREHDAISAATKRLCALFDCTVVTRCRDVMAAVRLDVVVAVGEWTVMYPSLFMKDAYLKYIAWGMSDKVSAAASRSSWSHLSASLACLCGVSMLARCLLALHDG